MTDKEGFVVVQKTLYSWEAPHNQCYRGVDRLVPFSMEHYSKGFDDPYVSSKYATEDGLIPSLSIAQEFLQIFTKIVEPDDLEILYVRESTNYGEKAPPVAMRFKFLGFDVASNGRPFYSLVSDFPPPSEASFKVFREQLNENGLFDLIETAKDYFVAYLEHYPHAQDQGTIIWEVYLVT